MRNIFEKQLGFVSSVLTLWLGVTIAASTGQATNTLIEKNPAPWKEDYGTPPRLPQDPISTEREQQLNWLYEKLFPVEIRQSTPTEVLRSFQVHLRDSDQQFPDPAFLQRQNLKAPGQIRGMITYVSIVQKQYLYDVTTDETGVVITVKIHLTNPRPDDVTAFAAKVHGAEDIWNAHRLATDFNYRFHFEIVENPKEAYFSVGILDSTRGPYDTNWSRDWSANVVAHEIGHMMGIADEYQPFGKAFGCYMPSLQCSAEHGAPMQHHYYFILRRLMRSL